MMELFAPSLTKNVPMMDVTTQLAPISSGNSISVVAASPVKKIEASTIVATIVTA
jgi:hypothetical protein